MPVQQLVIHQKNSRTLLDRWLKGFCHGAIGDREISHESCNTNFRTPCSSNYISHIYSRSNDIPDFILQILPVGKHLGQTMSPTVDEGPHLPEELRVPLIRQV